MRSIAVGRVLDNSMARMEIGSPGDLREAYHATTAKSACNAPAANSARSRLENEAVLDRMQARLAQRPDVLALRRETVEHPFGSIKQWMNQGAFLMRGLETGLFNALFLDRVSPKCHTLTQTAIG